MPRVRSMEELRRLKEEAQRDIRVRLDTGTKITIGMGTCGIAAGAREVMHAILDELQARDIEAHVTTVGCIGMCVREPLVDVQQAGGPRITYGNVKPAMVPRLIEEHLINGRIVEEWVVAKSSAAS
ncbi:MAG: (2Fe-2S) ferredoxin domain-containing protein [Chloroflexi bacterium]|nr:(2Fe-2S) ferredoxin domain-containing protein [Chloroflexota bacterium]MCL5107690.1 (2Fe-2S) ferredoxin domain-containing protein [Chloroflexota bacterium]